MTPAQLDALSQVHVRVHSDSPSKMSAPPSTNPAADLAYLASL